MTRPGDLIKTIRAAMLLANNVATIKIGLMSGSKQFRINELNAY